MLTTFQIAFQHKLHENVLEQILVQYEPDSIEFINFTQQVYDDINNNELFEMLRSYFYFVFFFLWIKKLQLIRASKRCTGDRNEIKLFFLNTI